MNLHHRRFFLRQWIEHRDPDNLRLHVVINPIGWAALVTLLSQLPLPLPLPEPLANAGAVFALLSVIYWMPVDLLVCAIVGSVTLVAAQLPTWGPGGGLPAVLLSLAVFTTTGLIALFAHIYYHEHADYLKTDQPLRDAWETTHAVIWGAFHFPLQGLLRAGWRPRVKAELDACTRDALQARTGVPWQNWGGTARCEPALISAPETIEELVAAVAEARQRKLPVRAVASGFSWSSVATTSGALVFVERLDGIEMDLSDPEQPAVWAEAGVTNRQLNAELARHGLTVPFNVVLETVRIAGLVSIGTHGSGRQTATMGDLVEALEVIDSKGQLCTLSEETIGVEAMRSVRLGFGLFGVIARVKLRVVPDYRVLQRDQWLPTEQVLQELPELVQGHDSVELYWFPFTKKLWLRTLQRTEQALSSASHGLLFQASNFAQLGLFRVATKLLDKVVPALTPPWMRAVVHLLRFRTRVLSNTDAQHYRRWIELLPCSCVEVGFKVNAGFANVRQAFELTQALTDEWAAKGRFPLNLTVNLRFVGPSDALLSPAFGAGLTCYIEALSAGRPDSWEEFSAELTARWLELDGALPHWAKEFEHVPGVEPLLRQRLASRLVRFQAALDSVGADPEGTLHNDLTRRLFLQPVDAAEGRETA